MPNSLLDILSNENLEILLNGLNWEWSDGGNKGIETVSIKELHNKSLLLALNVVQLISLHKNIQIGEYHYRITGLSISRTSPKIRKPDQNKITHTIKRIL